MSDHERFQETTDHENTNHATTSVEEAVLRYVGVVDNDIEKSGKKNDRDQKSKKRKYKSRRTNDDLSIYLSQGDYSDSHENSKEDGNDFEHNSDDGSNRKKSKVFPEDGNITKVDPELANIDQMESDGEHDVQEKGHIFSLKGNQHAHKISDNEQTNNSNHSSPSEQTQSNVDLVQRAIMETNALTQNPEFQKYFNTEGDLHSLDVNLRGLSKTDKDEEYFSGDQAKSVTLNNRKERKKPKRVTASTISDIPFDAKSSRLLKSEAAKEAAASGVRTSSLGKTFSEEEEIVIDAYIESYRQSKNFSDQELRQRVWSNEGRKDKFWIDLCKVLPDRTRSSLYKHVRRRYHIFEQRGKWTKEEDEELAKLCAVKEGQWAEIGKMLGRMPEDVRDRYRNYIKCGSKRTAQKWSAEEEERLMNVINEMLEEANEYAAKEANDENEVEIMNHNHPSFKDIINWTLVSERMGGTRSRIQCRYKWNRLVEKEALERINAITLEEKLWLCDKLKIMGFVKPNQINWDEIATLQIKDGNKWKGNELKLCYDQMKLSVANWGQKSVTDICDALITKYTHSLKNLE